MLTSTKLNGRLVLKGIFSETTYQFHVLSIILTGFRLRGYVSTEKQTPKKPTQTRVNKIRRYLKDIINDLKNLICGKFN